jgi:two-component system sensor histidine kinase GlrK
MNQSESLNLKQILSNRRKHKRWHLFDFFRIGSIFQWTVAALLVVTLPLILTLLYSIQSIEKYTNQSHTTLFQTLKASKHSQALLDNLLLMDRSIRQYKILEDPEIFKVYKEHHQTFKDNALLIGNYNLPENQLQLLTKLIHNETELYSHIVTKKNTFPDKFSSEDVKHYSQLRSDARHLVYLGNRQINIETTTLSELATLIRKQISYSALVSVLLALLLGLFLLYLINRPIKHIGMAINKLGNAQFSNRIHIAGPKDLRKIGKHLEWLRLKLIRLENSKQIFVKTISHELKTPLATLVEGTDLLQDELVGELNTEQHKIIELIQIANIRLNNLIENLLEYQKITSTQHKMAYSKVNMNQLVEFICKDYQLLLNSKNASITLEANPIIFLADRDKMRVIISNLFSNALKFSPDNGQILIKLEVIGYTLHILIADQGPGISKHQLPHIFTEFYKQSTPGSWKIKGSGLGLNLVKDYVAAHQGQIKLIAPDKIYSGANFLVLLPLTPTIKIQKT